MADQVLIDSLVEFYDETEIRGFWKQALDALVSRSSTIIHINSMSEDGQASGGIALSTPGEIRGFIETCKGAIAKLEGNNPVDPDTLGRGTDWSHRRVLP